MHVEHLGVKTLFVTFDPSRVLRDNQDRALLTMLNGSTETRILLTEKQHSELPDEPCMLVVEGDATLHIHITDDFELIGYEVLVAKTLTPSACTMREPGFVETIPF